MKDVPPISLHTLGHRYEDLHNKGNWLVPSLPGVVGCFFSGGGLFLFRRCVVSKELTIHATQAAMPEGLSLKAKLMWRYYFEIGDWGAVHHTDSGAWMVFNEHKDLNCFTTYEDEESFIRFLEHSATDYLELSPEEFIGTFMIEKDLLDKEIVEAIVRRVNTTPK